MFDRLIESRPARRRGGAQVLAAVAVHGALVAAAVQATTATAALGDVPVAADTIIWTVDEPAAAPDVPRAEAPVENDFLPAAPDATEPLPVPDVGAIAIPPVDPAVGFDPRDHAKVRALTRGDRPTGGGLPGGSGEAADSAPVFASAQLDRVVEVIEQPTPVFPPALRDAGLEGYVDLEFVVGSDGRVEAGSVAVRDATHEAYAASAHVAIMATRFRPAMLRGQPVRQLVRQRVRFDLAAATRPTSGPSRRAPSPGPASTTRPPR